MPKTMGYFLRNAATPIILRHLMKMDYKKSVRRSADPILLQSKDGKIPHRPRLPRPSRYVSHQNVRECNRRVRQMEGCARGA